MTFKSNILTGVKTWNDLEGNPQYRDLIHHITSAWLEDTEYYVPNGIIKVPFNSMMVHYEFKLSDGHSVNDFYVSNLETIGTVINYKMYPIGQIIFMKDIYPLIKDYVK